MENKRIMIDTIVDEHEIYNSKGDLLGKIYPTLDDRCKYESSFPHTLREMQEVVRIMESLE